MSHYTDQSYPINDIPTLVQALLETWQYARGQHISLGDIEIHNEPQHLFGYMGDKRAQKANVIIRKRNVGNAANDIGFLVENGTCTAFISEYDKNHYSSNWMKRMQKSYSTHRIVNQAKKENKRVEFIERNGKQVVRVHVR